MTTTVSKLENMVATDVPVFKWNNLKKLFASLSRYPGKVSNQMYDNYNSETSLLNFIFCDAFIRI